MLGLIYGIYMFNMICIANVACRYRVSLLVFNSRSYLFAAWNIELNTRREIPYQLKILLVCCVIYWVEQLQRNSISVYVHVLFYMYLLTFFPYCVSYLGKYTHRTWKYFFHILPIRITPQVGYFTDLVWLQSILYGKLIFPYNRWTLQQWEWQQMEISKPLAWFARATYLHWDHLFQVKTRQKKSENPNFWN